MTTLEKLEAIKARVAVANHFVLENTIVGDIPALVSALKCAIEALDQIRYSNRLPDDFEVLKRISLATHDWSHQAITKIEQIMTGEKE